ncbi:hypothetical protein [uncultured Shewanella sp.]|uniref:hypothetical protein n=1 Tax=uncultured Shewanella sp. TaxID=173975 RepID=UPI00262D182A|nr:hypothetical protein [uncultured Shewanella sp.]
MTTRTVDFNYFKIEFTPNDCGGEFVEAHLNPAFFTHLDPSQREGFRQFLGFKMCQIMNGVDVEVSLDSEIKQLCADFNLPPMNTAPQHPILTGVNWFSEKVKAIFKGKKVYPLEQLPLQVSPINRDIMTILNTDIATNEDIMH